ncbi:MAG: peptidoglycan DD-metalloendopeptidase family protein [Gammaproteobacteria bacterium]|nr:peptidoglycan DD-metalloendopeptidase family protein [Gammaproteobacteria bacterium]
MFFPEPSLAEERELAEKKAELTALNEKIAVLQKAMRNRQSKLDKEDAALKDVDLRIDGINSNLRDLDRRKSEIHDELSDLQIKKRVTTASLEGEQVLLSQQLRSAYISGHEEYIKLIMNQQDPAAVSRMLVYYRYLTESRVRIINQINTHLEQLLDLKTAIQKRSAEMKVLIKNERARWQSLNAAYKEQEKAVLVIHNEQASDEQQIQRMLQDEQELLGLIEKLGELLDELLEEERVESSFRDYRGQLNLPVKNKIRVRYGTRRKIGNLRWKGIVISGELGVEINSIYTGRVVYADWMRGFGLLLIIDHGDSYLSLYGHNESLLVEEGDWVLTGQTIATMGKSGGSNKPGLYFEIRYKGRPQNPLHWARR